MRIGFNGLPLLPSGGGGGVSNYMAALYAALAQIQCEHELILYLRSDNHLFDELDGAGLRIQRVEVPSGPRGVQFAARVFTEQFRLTRLAAADKLDVLHWPDHVIGLWSPPPCPQVVTVHDLTVFSHAETHSQRTRLYMGRLIPPTVTRAARILCDSQSTADDLTRRFGVPPARLDTVLLAASSHYQLRDSAAIAATLARWKLQPQGYFLFLSTLEPRKNVDGLLRAYKLAVDAGVTTPLVIAGRRGRYYEAIFQLMESLQLGERVIYTDFVSTDEAVDLYNGAMAFVYPSHYEGFGLPILEAMACGAPVITTNISSLPEVAGDAGLLLPPGDDAALAQALQRVAGDGELRAHLREAGLQQAATFSWQRCALETVASCARAAREQSARKR